MTNANMNHSSDAQAAANKFLALNSGNIAAYLEACVHCGQCATACHFYEVTGNPKYTPAYKLFPMARAHKRSKWPRSLFGGPKISEEDLQEWEELLYDSCTMCGRCTQVCPMGIDIASIVAASRQAFAAAGRGPKDLFEAAENVRDKGSPLGVTPKVFDGRVENRSKKCRFSIHKTLNRDFSANIARKWLKLPLLNSEKLGKKNKRIKI